MQMRTSTAAPDTNRQAHWRADTLPRSQACSTDPHRRTAGCDGQHVGRSRLRLNEHLHAVDHRARLEHTFAEANGILAHLRPRLKHKQSPPRQPQKPCHTHFATLASAATHGATRHISALWKISQHKRYKFREHPLRKDLEVVSRGQVSELLAAGRGGDHS